MGVLKTVGYILLALLGLSVATGIGIVLSALSGIIGFTFLGAGVVFVVAAFIKDYFDSK